MDWIKQINEITTKFEDSFQELDSKALNYKVSPETWSIAQNIDHIIKINQTYVPILEELKSGELKSPIHAKLGFIVNFFGRFILNSVHPDRKTKIKTFSIWQPSQSEIGGDILNQFKTHQEELKKMIIDCKELVEKEAVICSPANKMIVYKLSTAFDIIVTHELRHYNQAMEAKSNLPK
jgi:hypothetical protein